MDLINITPSTIDANPIIFSEAWLKIISKISNTKPNTNKTIEVLIFT